MPFFTSKTFKKYTRKFPITLIDVGARGGIHRRWNSLKENLLVFGFEPDEEEYNRLKKNAKENQIYSPIALYDKRCEVSFNKTQMPGASSLYQPDVALKKHFLDEEKSQIVSTKKIQADTLDRVMRINKVSNVDFLKVDTQGSELKVLEGSKELLKKSIFGIRVEVEFIPLYKEQPLFPEIDRYLKSLGFVLFDLYISRAKRRKYKKVYSKGQVLSGDALYFKDLIDPKIDSSYLSFEKAIKNIAISELYGYLDFSLELLDFYKTRRIIKDAIYEDIKKILIKKTIKNILSSEYQLLDIIRPTFGFYLKERIPFVHNLYNFIVIGKKNGEKK